MIQKIVYTSILLSISILFSCQDSVEDPSAGSLPIADFIFQPQTTNGRIVNFASTSQNADYLIWDYGDGIARGFLNSVTYTFTKNGTFKVKLTAGNKAGVNTKTVDITVNGIFDPAPDFEMNFSSITNTLQIAVVNKSQYAATYFWNFGDGQTSALANPPMHQYAAAGTYKVELAASNVLGTKTEKKSITVTVLDNRNLSDSDGKSWKFRTALYRVAKYPVNDVKVGNFTTPNPSRTYFVLRNGSLAYESDLLNCELNDVYTFNLNGTYTNNNAGDARILESRNECRSYQAQTPSAFTFSRKSLSQFIVNTGSTYIGDLKGSATGYEYEIVELSETILVLSYLRADQTNPSLQERVVMVFEP
jgi:PKD repeat protein